METTLQPFQMQATPNSYRGPFWVPIDLTIGIIQCVTYFICVIYCSYIFQHQYNADSSPSKILNILTFICLLSFLMSAVSITVNGYEFNTIYWKYTPIVWNSWQLAWFFWSFGQCLSYLLFIYRLQLTFTESVYEITHKIKIYLYILLVTYLVLWIIITCIPLYLLNADETDTQNIEEKQFWDFQLYFSCIISLIDILITSSMTYMFVSKLYKLILEHTKPEMKDGNLSKLSIDELEERHVTIINISIKVTVLSLISLLSSVITVAFRAISYFYADPDDDHKSHRELLYGIFVNNMVIWLQIDTVISSICLVLFLPNSQKIYQVLCCCCHQMILKRYKHRLHKYAVEMNDNAMDKMQGLSRQMTNDEKNLVSVADNDGIRKHLKMEPVPSTTATYTSERSIDLQT